MMKGLFEWKILAAILAVLIVASSALISNTGVRDIFLNSTGSLGDWMSGSPFDSLFSTPQKDDHMVVIRLSSDTIRLDIETPVNISTGDSSLLNFRGVLSLDFNENSSRFLPAESDLVLDLELEGTEIKNVRMPKLVFEGIDFVVESEKTNISASDDRIEIYDFHGDISITDAVELSGNVSKVNNEKWSIS
jgi:hypothetical protein